MIEKRLESSVIHNLEAAYQFPLDQIEVISIKEKDDPYKYKLLGIDKIFTGKDYTVKMKVNEDIPIIVEGSINTRKRVLQGNNYIQNKHEALVQQDHTYQQEIEDIRNMHVEIIGVDEEHYYKTYHKGMRTLLFYLDVQDRHVDADELMRSLHRLAELILEYIETDIALNLQFSILEYQGDQFEREEIQVKIYDEQQKNVLKGFERQLQQVRSLHVIDEKLIQELETFGTDIFTSLLYPSKSSRHNTVYEHHFGLTMDEEFSEKTIPKIIDMLKEKGLGESYIFLYYSNGRTHSCKVGEIQKVEDFNDCLSRDESWVY